MADFAPAYGAMRLIEGPRNLGYVNDPNDVGGETVAGISRHFHPDAAIWILVDAAKARPDFPKSLGTPENRSQLEAAVSDFYFAEFWQPGRFETMPDQSVANEVFEQAVNLGMPRAITHLQMSLNALNLYGQRWRDLPVDGVPGPATTYAAARCHAVGMSPQLLKACNIFQGHFYLTNKNERYINGWMARVALA